ncbi:MAG TPA: glycosyltransferase family 4 protein [Nocardioidaceae bacterium]|nr:glycosyltransferase family 4 protein [Nocardioidaceae bacterium]
MSRILFVSNDFPTRRGGIETFVLSLAQNLPPDEVVVYTASMPGDLEYDASLPFPVYRDPTSMLLPTPAVGRRVVDVMERHDCDRVVFGASAPLGLLAPRLRRAGARRMVALTHGHEVWWARVPVTRQLLRRIGDSVDVITYVSDWCRDRIAPALSADAAVRMRRLSPGVDTDRFYPGCGGAEVRARLGIPADAPVVVCTARMVKRKGQDRLVEAWPEVVRRLPAARLLLVGDGPNRRSVELLAQKLGVAGHITFTGAVPWEDVPGHTDAGDVFAMPCRTRLVGMEPEAFGIVFLEARACGLPVLAGDSGGAPEALDLNGPVVVVDAHDGPGHVARKLSELLELVEPGRGRVRPAAARDHDWRRLASYLAALLSG